MVVGFSYTAIRIESRVKLQDDERGEIAGCIVNVAVIAIDGHGCLKRCLCKLRRKRASALDSYDDTIGPTAMGLGRELSLLANIIIFA